MQEQIVSFHVSFNPDTLYPCLLYVMKQFVLDERTACESGAIILSVAGFEKVL